MSGEIEDFLGALNFKGMGLGGKPKPSAAKTELIFNTKEFNVCAISVRNWTDGRFRDGMRPLFRAQALNFCILSKEVVPKHLNISLRPYQLATKVFFPYDIPQAVAEQGNKDGQSISGRSFHVGQRKYIEILTGHFMGGLSEEDRRHDIQMLDALAAIPSMDPFLIKDRFETDGMAIDPEYLAIDEARWKTMKDQIIEEFAPIAQKAFGEGRDLRQKTSVLVQKLWEATDLNALAPLTAALKLRPEQAGEVYYSWKGILFYRQQYKAAIARLEEFFDFLKTSKEWTSRIKGSGMEYNWAHIVKQVRVMVAEINFIMERYDEVTRAFYGTGTGLNEFIRFFGMAPDFFWLLGSNLACFEHCLKKTREFRMNKYPSNEVIDDLYRSLYSVATFADRE